MKFKKILHIFLWLLAIAAIVILLVYSNRRQKILKCKSYQIEIDAVSNDTLLYKKDINNILVKCSDSIVGKQYKRINMAKIENELNKFKYIKSAKVYGDLYGNIVLQAEPYQPIVRVFTNKNKNFFLDEKGNKISSDRPFYVLIANGNFENENALKDLLKLLNLIKNDSFLSSQIGEIYRTNDGIYKLNPIVGDHEIILGRPDNFEDGLQKLKLFYENGMNRNNWNEFKKIDVRFRDQVVAQKNNYK